MIALSVDWPTVLRSLLFGLFAVLTAIVAAVTGPTYDGLLVPMLQPSALFPPLRAAGGGPTDFLSSAVQFSSYTLVNVVDPAIALVGAGVALLYLARSAVARWTDSLSGLLPRLVVAVIVSNFTLPIAAGVLDLAGALYPVFAGWNGAAWEHWVNLGGDGEVQFSWDNGALALILSIVEFLAVLALVLAIGVRDATLSVLIVLLPLFTLLWPLRPFSSIPRRAWLLFLELAFLPCVLIVPLQLAVRTSSPVLLIGYLGVALASPFLLSVAGTNLAAFGFPTSGGVISGGLQRGLSTASGGPASIAGPSANAAAGTGAGGRALAGAVRSAGTAGFPAAAPLAAGTILGHTALHLLRHLPSADTKGAGRWPPMRGGGVG
ncbi:MAG: hypothetical protein L3K02_01165 [Thermoplasmata archaeon]|nr:hypothetical protein [Thermoplasmata archaeon]